MIERILFATDFSPISAGAEEYVRQLAGATHCSVVILHAIEPIAGLDVETDDTLRRFLDGLVSNARAKAGAVLDRFEKAEIDTSFRVEVAKRWKAVVDVADEEDVDLIVIGSHAVREGGKLYVGTTSHKVFFSTDRPLMVVPHHAAAEG